MIILAITTDDKLVNRIKAVGQVMKCTSIDLATNMIESGEFDAVVIASPYADIKTHKIKHNNISVIKSDDDLASFVRNKGLADPFPEFEIKKPATQKPARKLKKANPEPDIINPKELGKLLLATTNIVLVQYLNEYDLRVVTTGFTARKALGINPKIVLWDLTDEPIETPGVLLYQWGTDIQQKEELLSIMANADLGGGLTTRRGENGI